MPAVIGKKPWLTGRYFNYADIALAGRETSVSEVMQENPISVPPNTPTLEAIELYRAIEERLDEPELADLQRNLSSVLGVELLV